MADKHPFWKRLWEGWKHVAAKIAHVQGHVLLSLIYILVVSPIALLFKAAGQDPLFLKPLKSAPSYWVRRNPIASVVDFLKKAF